MKVVLEHLENLPWTTETGLNINPIPSDRFEATLLPGGVLQVLNESSRAMGGALVACKPAALAPVNLLTMPYFGLDLEMYVPVEQMAQAARIEIDVKRVITGSKPGIKVPQIGDGSTQLNCATGMWQGMWQIDKAPPSWVDTGFKPIVTSAWTPISFRFWMNATRYSVLSTEWDKMKFNVPVAMQNLPLETSDWGKVFAVQLQTEILTPGVLLIYFRNITATLSDEPY